MTIKPRIQKSSSVSHPYVSHGLSLPASVLRAIQKRGIYCDPNISIEHQHLAKRYVLRGVESGGAVVDMGRVCAYLSSDGNPLPWLQSIDSIAVNGRHAIILAESLVRIEMLRTLRTYQLVMTRHDLSVSAGSTRPEISSRLLFRGEDGVLPFDLWTEEQKTIRGQLAPTFYSRSGEVIHLPERFETAIRKMTGAVCCVGCRHTHIGVPPGVQEI
jgi:hypothetical protein